MEDIQKFKECLSTFVTGVTVITIMEEKVFYGITVNSFNSVSLKPPLILFSIGKTANRLKLLLNSEHFVINILSEKQAYISKIFAENYVNGWQSFFKKDYAWPVLEGVISYLVCTKHYIYEGGDHNIIVGRVRKVCKLSEESPLIYYKRNYYNLGNICND